MKLKILLDPQYPVRTIDDQPEIILPADLSSEHAVTFKIERQYPFKSK